MTLWRGKNIFGTKEETLYITTLKENQSGARGPVLSNAPPLHKRHAVINIAITQQQIEQNRLEQAAGSRQLRAAIGKEQRQYIFTSIILILHNSILYSVNCRLLIHDI